MRISSIFVSAIGVTLLCGCTELKVKRATPGQIEGIPYTLPKKTFVVTVTYELKECIDAVSPPQVKASKMVNVTPTTQPDDNERFYIPYASLRNWFKDTSITVESYENQTLKGVSSTITDKTGEAITSIVSSAIKLATFGAGAAPSKAPTEVKGAKCNPDAVAALAKLVELKKKEKPTEQETATIADLRSQVTHKEVVYWSPAKPTPLPDQKKVPLILEITISPTGLVGGGGKWVIGDAAVIANDLTSTVQLTVNGTVTADAATPPSGFLLRQGPSATLRVCERSCPIPTVDGTGAVQTDETPVLNTSVHIIPQLGSYVGMPLKNRLFEAQTLTISLSAEGAVTKLGLTSNATAVAALQTFGTNLDALSKAEDARKKAEAAAAESEQNAKKDHADRVAKDNNAVADCLKAQKALRDAGGTVTGTCQ